MLSQKELAVLIIHLEQFLLMKKKTAVFRKMSKTLDKFYTEKQIFAISGLGPK